MMRMYLFPGVAAMAASALYSPHVFATVVTLPTSDIVAVSHDLANHWSNPDGNYPATETPAQAIDGSTATKYLNFAGAGLDDTGAQTGNPTGFIVTLPSAVSIGSFRMATANDFPSRDPSAITIEGGNFGGKTSADIAATDSDSDWTLIYSGASGITTGQARFTFGPEIDFADSADFTSFRVIITDLVRYAGNAPTNSQFSEIELIASTPVPEPASMGLAAVGGVGLLWRRRRN